MAGPESDSQAARGLRSRLAPPLAGFGLAWLVVVLVRTHELLAGMNPAPGALATAAVAIGLALGVTWPATRPRSAALHVLAATLGSVAVVGLSQAALSRWSGVGALAFTCTCTFVVSWLVGRSRAIDPERHVASPLLAAGLGTLVASLGALPWAGAVLPGHGAAIAGVPAVVALLAAFLCSGGDAELRGAESGSPVSRTGWTAVACVAAGLAAGISTWLACNESPTPWLQPFVTAGIVLVMAGAAARLLPRGAVLLLAPAALISLVPVGGHSLVHHVLEPLGGLVAASTPPVSPVGGLLLLLLAGVLHGVLPGALVGCLAPRRRNVAGSGDEAAAQDRPWRTFHWLGWLAVGLAVSAQSLVILPLALGTSSGAVAAESEQRGEPGATLHEESSVSVGAGGAVTHVSTWTDVTDRLDVARVAGRTVIERSLEHRPTDLLAGHLAALLPPSCSRALVAGGGTGWALDALAAHGVDVDLWEPSEELASVAAAVRALDQGPFAPAAVRVAPAPALVRRVGASPAAWDAAPSTYDAVLLQVGDPTLPAFQSFFTRQAREAVATLLKPGGVLVEVVDTDRTGPEDLARLATSLRDTFADVRLATADHLRCGHVLLVARRPGEDEAPGAGDVPFGRLVIDSAANPRMTPAVVASLEQALLLDRNDLLLSFAAGKAEIDAIAGRLSPREPWTERGLAFRYPAAESLARAFARTALLSRFATVELPVEPGVLDQSGPFPTVTLLAGIESSLPPEWKPARGLVRYSNRVASFLGEAGLYRDTSARVILEREGGTITITEQPRSLAGPGELVASLSTTWSQDAKRQGTSMLHGHPALWLFTQPSPERQSVVITWHCPLQQRLYLADYTLSDGKPGIFAQPLELLGRHVRCAHGTSSP